ncbi:hypothetical protein GPECTOR_7g1077 [Gonium pectorale]|uniref:Uncharacterized protein n=1 Tax=Gonium pectorale TaxID=33097 RepID=A0A150GTJ7_GONPE|nr:hypothetical protein GPECTOR_7g1077 [Gonium pectorale]|eukprot:KXZ53185.1 hypothetical protein GPECTOR_7g1077 [Gonium pectorale]
MATPSSATQALAQRQWRQRAQTAVRTAVTAAKEARSKFQDRVAQLEACVASLQQAVATVGDVAQDEPWMRTSPVFHTLPLPRVRQLLDKVYDMYRLEYGSKAAVLAAMGQLVARPAFAEAEAGVVGGASATTGTVDPYGATVLAEVARLNGGRVAAKRLPDLCTTYISVWMLSPYVEDEQADEVLGAISEDMVSF